MACMPQQGDLDRETEGTPSGLHATPTTSTSVFPTCLDWMIASHFFDPCILYSVILV